MNSNVPIVTVVNNFAPYERSIKNNPFCEGWTGGPLIIQKKMFPSRYGITILSIAKCCQTHGASSAIRISLSAKMLLGNVDYNPVRPDYSVYYK